MEEIITYYEYQNLLPLSHLTVIPCSNSLGERWNAEET